MAGIVEKLLENNRSWDKDGVAKLYKSCEEVVASAESDDQDEALVGFICLLVTKHLQGAVKRDAVHSIAEAMREKFPNTISVFADALSVIDGTFQTTAKLGNRETFYVLVKDLEKILGDSLLKERMEFDTLENCGVLKAKGSKFLNQKHVKLRTKLYFKQHKFNLLREETEGFSKLITEIVEKDDQTIDEKIQAIRSLIGCFNLDPNRVLDLILESFECHPQYHLEVSVPLIKRYMPDARVLSEILGFKFTSFQSLTKSSEEKTPTSLFVLTVLLLEHKLIELEDIYSWLYPDDTVVDKCALEEERYAQKCHKKMTHLSTVQKDEDEEAPLRFDASAYASNQKLRLLEAALLVGAWNIASMLLEKFSKDWVMCNTPVFKAAAALVHVSIEPIYRIYAGVPEKVKGMHVKNPLHLSPSPATSFEQLKLCAIPVLKAIGPYGYQDPILMYKVIRLLKAALSQELPHGKKTLQPPTDTDHIYYNVLEVIDDFLLPSMTMLDSPCSMSEELWSLVKLLPYQIRYRLYSFWKDSKCDSHPLLIHRKVEQFMKIKYFLKRISKDNVKYIGRVLGKLSHSMPGLLFDYVIRHAQMFENLINPVVDSLKFLTGLSLDVLGYCLMDSLSVKRDPFSDDGTSIDQWLTALSSMIATTFWKYRNIEVEPMLQFVVNQLKAKRSVFLLILKEIIQKMSGIEPGDEISANQLDAMAGGDLLRTEAAGFFNQQRNPKKTAQRLKDALIDSKLVVPLCALISQQLNCTIFEENTNAHAKLVQRLYDQCQDTFVQFGNFLATTLSPEEYQNLIPKLDVLCEHYQLDLGSAFFLYRPIISHSIASKWDELRKSDRALRSAPQAEKNSKYIAIVESVMGPVVEMVRPRLSEKVWEEFSPQFFATFWSLSLSDLYVPTNSYQREIERARKAANAALDNKEMAEVKRKKESDRLHSLADKLAEEEKKQKEHVERVTARLRHEKESWFVYSSPNKYKTETVIHVLSQCVIPRSLLSEPDAAYSAKLIEQMHQLKTPNFATLICYDRLFCDITHTINSCSEYECRRYGRFLSSMLQTVMRWHGDKSTFEKECSSYPGFITKFRAGNQSGADSADQVDYENYRHVCHKWHHKIGKALLIGIESTDYVAERNALIIARSILEQFPVQISYYTHLDKKVEEMKTREKEKRADLFTMALSYLGQLRARKSFMIREEAFHNKPPRPQAKPASGEPAAEQNGGTPVTAAKKESEGEKTPVNGTASLREATAAIKKEAKENRKTDRREDRDKSGKPEDGPREKRVKIEKVEDGEIPSANGGDSLDQDKDQKRRSTLKVKEEVESPRSGSKKGRNTQPANDDDYEEGMIDEKEERKRERKRDRGVEDSVEPKRKRESDGKGKSRTANGTEADKKSDSKKEARDYDRERRSNSKSRKTGDKRR